MRARGIRPIKSVSMNRFPTAHNDNGEYYGYRRKIMADREETIRLLK